MTTRNLLILGFISAGILLTTPTAGDAHRSVKAHSHDAIDLIPDTETESNPEEQEIGRSRRDREEGTMKGKAAREAEKYLQQRVDDAKREDMERKMRMENEKEREHPKKKTRQIYKKQDQTTGTIGQRSFGDH